MKILSKSDLQAVSQHGRRHLTLGLGLWLMLSPLGHAQQRGQGRTAPSVASPEVPSSNNNMPSSSASMLTDTNRDYLIAAGDVVEVWVEDAPELSRNYRVNAAGDFPMDIVGRIAARDKTAEDLAQQIAGRLRDAEYLVKPNVVVTIRQFNSQTFIIQGSVNKPGIYQLEGRPNLLTLIGLAGGLNDAHGSTAYILRPKPRKASKDESSNQEAAPKMEAGPNLITTRASALDARIKAAAKNEPPAEATTGSDHTVAVNQNNPETAQVTAQETALPPTTKPTAKMSAGQKTDPAAIAENTAGSATENQEPGKEAQEKNTDDGFDPSDYELIRVNLSALYKGHFENNETLEPRDIVNIPRADVFFVAGEVNSPGSFVLKEGTTLRQAISLAQGLTFKAKAGNGVIFREDPDSGKRQELKIDISAVMNGKREDLVISANDVIIIPNSRTKSISSALLTALGVNSARIPIRY